jgi:hypothetical protein
MKFCPRPNINGKGSKKGEEKTSVHALIGSKIIQHHRENEYRDTEEKGDGNLPRFGVKSGLVLFTKLRCRG